MASLVSTYPALWDILQISLALALIVAWGISFICAPGGRRRWLLGLRRFRPHSTHWPISIGVSTGVVIPTVWLIWPDLPGKEALLMILAFLIAAELALRCFPPKPGALVDLSSEENLFTSRLYQPHHYTLFEPRPNIHTAAGLAHNRWGFRDHRSLEPDAQAIRLVFLGGAVMYGATTRDNAALFTRHLENRLNAAYQEQLNGRRFEVINAAMADATSAEMLLRQIFAVSEIHPTLVAIQIGHSEIWTRTVSDDYFGDFRQLRKPYGHGRLLQPRMSVADSLTRAFIWRSALLNSILGSRVPAENLLELNNRDNTGHPARLQKNPPIYLERNLRYILTLNQEMGARSLLIGNQLPKNVCSGSSYHLAIPEHNALMARIAQERQVPFFDLEAALPLTDEVSELSKYLNFAGQQRLAELLFEFLSQAGLIDALLEEKYDPLNRAV